MYSIYKHSKYNISIEIENERKIIYNSFSRMLSVLERDEVSLFNGIMESDPNSLNLNEKKILDNLLINNFVVPADVDETTLLEKKYQSIRYAQDQATLTIVPTLSCNFECNYCYQGSLKDKSIMSPEVQARTIDFIKQNIKDVKRVSLTWFGGEPLIGLKAIKNLSDRIIPYCDKNGIFYQATLITNGYMLTQETVGDLYARRLRTIQITLDGPREVHNSIRYVKGSRKDTFDRILKNIALYCDDYPIQTVIRVNMDMHNKGKVKELIDQLSDAGLGNKNVSMYFAPIESSTSVCRRVAADTLDIRDFSNLEFDLYKMANKNGLCKASLPMQFMGLCGATKPKGYVIVPNGDIHKCWETVSFPERRIGNVNDGNISLTNTNKLLWEQWSPFQNDTCRSCTVLPNCVGFCPYKHLYKSEYAGNSANLPCPSIKFNIKERILDFAEKSGIL